GAFAEQVEAIQQSGARSSLQPIARVERSQPVPLSYS
ncbi:peptide synthase, partial [Pseudomonas syringae pv. pisi str. 1704B]